jgi:hypothetical protein
MIVVGGYFISGSEYNFTMSCVKIIVYIYSMMEITLYMAFQNKDGVIEAVRYASNARIDVVRAYERRQSAFSDRKLIKRKDLINKLGSSFQISKSVRVVLVNGKQIITTKDKNIQRDELGDVPLF